MPENERLQEDEQRLNAPDPGGDQPDAQRITRLRLDGEAFLSAGDEAISRALSGDSAAFLEASRQSGGE